MSAFNNSSSLNNNGLDNRDSNLASTGITGDRQLNENHGIAATGLNEPLTHATAPTTQGTTAERRGDNLNFSGAPVAGHNVDQAAGLHNPSETNRTAGTGIPPVNTAEHAKHNAENALTGHHHTTGTGLTGDHHHHTTGTGLTGDHHHNNTTGAALTGNHPHNATGESDRISHSLSGNPEFGTAGVATAAASAERHLSGDHHHNAGERHHDLSNVSAKNGDHGASHHHTHATNNTLDEKAARIGTDATHPTGSATGATGASATAAPGAINDGVRHAGEPQHDGLLPKKDRHRDEHHAETGSHPTTSDGVEGKPSVGDKIKGNLEKVAGKISGNEAKVIAGDNKAHGRV